MKKLLFVAFLSLFLVACGQNNDSQNNLTNNEQTMTVTAGKTIGVDYVGKTTDGKVFDTSIQSVATENGLYDANRNYAPLEFTVGSGNMIKGFDDGVVGMKLGETKTLNIPVDQAYGQVDPNAVQTLPKSVFSGSWIPLEANTTFQYAYGKAKIVSVTGDNVVVDFNHELAGKDLVFEVTVKSIK